MMNYQVLENPNALAERAADIITGKALDSVKKRGVFNLVLAGGDTPKTTYSILADASRGRAVPWDHVRLFWGDERCVEPGHEHSNFTMAMNALKGANGINRENVHRIPAEDGPQKGAAAYDALLHSLYPEAEWPGFDLVILGIGPDGHVASLFPENRAWLDEKAWVLTIRAPKNLAPRVERVTLSLGAFNAAGSILVLASGKEKKIALASAAQGDESLPASRLDQSKCLWLLDPEAAELIT